MAYKLDISRVLKAVDLHNYDFYSELTQEEKKGFNPYVLMRYTSNAKFDDTDLQTHLVETTNEYVNKNYFVLAKNHQGLLWKLYAATGVGATMYHPYLAVDKEKLNKTEELIADLNPTMKIADVKLLAQLITKEEVKELLDGLGMDDKELKRYK